MTWEEPGREDMTLNDYRTALVTGASNGIGEAVVGAGSRMPLVRGALARLSRLA